MSKKIRDWLSSVDIEELSARFEKHLDTEEDNKKNFWASDLCSRMIADFLRVGSLLSPEDFGYFEDATKSKYGWEDISNDDVKQFFNTMQCCRIGVESEITRDDENPFENWSFVKRGVEVRVMIGQGTSVLLSPAE